MIRIFLILCIGLIFYTARGQEPRVLITEGKGVMQINDMISKAQAREKAKEMAIIDAIESAFGRVIIQGNATYLQSLQTGSKVETTSNFSSVSSSTVKGEVIEIISEKYDEIKTTRRIDRRKKITEVDIVCKVKVKARELTDKPVEFEAFALSSNRGIMRPISEFKSGSAFYFYFKSPVSGFLSLYSDDRKISQRLLPYFNQPADSDNGFAVQADKEYVFFSMLPEHSYGNDYNNFAHELQVMGETERDHNRLFVVFSQNPLNKPALKENLNSELQKKVARGFTQPRSLESELFQRWKLDNMQLRSDMQVKIIDYIIAQ